MTTMQMWSSMGKESGMWELSLKLKPDMQLEMRGQGHEGKVFRPEVYLFLNAVKSFASEWSPNIPFHSSHQYFRVNLQSISVAEDERSRLKASTQSIHLIKHFCTSFNKYLLNRTYLTKNQFF